MKQVKQIKSAERVRDYAEVFTHQREINKMLALVEQSALRNKALDARYLEPACGEGAFLMEILRRKLNHKDLAKLKRKQKEWELNALIGLASLYGVDILEDNIKLCRYNLENIFLQEYQQLFNKKINEEYIKNIQFILNKNIILGDALSYKTLDNKPIIFSEFSLAGLLSIKRKDYHFEELINGNKSSVLDKEYQIVNYLSLYKEQEIDGTARNITS